MSKGVVIDARGDRIDSSPFWHDNSRCRLPVTSWIEYVVQEIRNVSQRVALPGGEPFHNAGVCGMRDGT